MWFPHGLSSQLGLSAIRTTTTTAANALFSLTTAKYGKTSGHIQTSTKWRHCLFQVLLPNTGTCPLRLSVPTKLFFLYFSLKNILFWGEGDTDNVLINWPPSPSIDDYDYYFLVFPKWKYRRFVTLAVFTFLILCPEAITREDERLNRVLSNQSISFLHHHPLILTLLLSPSLSHLLCKLCCLFDLWHFLTFSPSPSLTHCELEWNKNSSTISLLCPLLNFHFEYSSLDSQSFRSSFFHFSSFSKWLHLKCYFSPLVTFPCAPSFSSSIEPLRPRAK